MGSWSVYCGISNITINYGTPCVLLPLKTNRTDEYHEYSPATLPIFGTYDDYGGLKDIIETEGTKLIEKHFNCTIDQFAYYFTRGCISTNEDDFPKFLLDNTEISDWKFMFIHKEVYDFMIQAPYDSWRGLSFGYTNMLEYLDFKLVNTEGGTQTWEKDGKQFTTTKYSDSLTVSGTNNNIYYLLEDNKDTSGYHNKHSLTHYVDIDPEKLAWLSNKNRAQVWSIMDKKYFFDEVGYIIGRSRGWTDPIDSMRGVLEMLESDLEDFTSEEERIKTQESIGKLKRRIELLGEDDDVENTRTLMDRITSNYKLYADDLANMIRIKQVFHSMSGTWRPFDNYLTPQCGDYQNHKVLLEKFLEINNSHCEDEYDE